MGSIFPTYLLVSFLFLQKHRYQYGYQNAEREQLLLFEARSKGSGVRFSLLTSFFWPVAVYMIAPALVTVVSVLIVVETSREGSLRSGE